MTETAVDLGAARAALGLGGEGMERVEVRPEAVSIPTEARVTREGIILPSGQLLPNSAATRWHLIRGDDRSRPAFTPARGQAFNADVVNGMRPDVSVSELQWTERAIEHYGAAGSDWLDEE